MLLWKSPCSEICSIGISIWRKSDKRDSLLWSGRQIGWSRDNERKTREDVTFPFPSFPPRRKVGEWGRSWRHRLPWCCSSSYLLPPVSLHWFFAIFCFLSFDGQFSACCVVSDLLNVLYIVVQCSVNDPGWLCQLACLLEIWESDISSILDRHDVKSSWWRQQFVGRLAHYSVCLYIRTDRKAPHLVKHKE